MLLYQTTVMTPLGKMLALADDERLYQLHFLDECVLSKFISPFLEIHPVPKLEQNKLLITLQKELDAYFKGDLTHFTIPTHRFGSLFEQNIYHALKQIPYGQTQSYAALAEAAGYPRAYRAAGSTNAQNPIAILVPCHRVIQKNGHLGGYNGGIDRKQKLIQHEQQVLLS